MLSLWPRFVGFLFSIGEYPEESPEQQARRRIWIAAALASLLINIPFIFRWLDLGFTRVAVATAVIFYVVAPSTFVVLYFKPRSYVAMVQTVAVFATLQQIYLTWLFGGFHESGLAALLGLALALVLLILLGRGAGLFWFVMFIAQVIFAMVISGRVEPTYEFGNPAIESGLNTIVTGLIVMAVLLYFIRQRDRFQQQSDDLLHNILPDEIANRLKEDTSMIADDFAKASVLFADLVDFTPMSADMSPPELVGLLNSVFTKFDEFVAELGLEKIKTVGDEYMAAAGVPIARDDHAEAIAELALRIRNHMAEHEVDGHQLSLRIGISSGPVVAGIIGTHKFSYDMWGDTVNTASRMESEGIAGKIQVSPATYELIRRAYVFEPRGTITVKGKGEMETYILTARLK